jgi:tripartite ATP-independent transporter DctM subunit
MSVELIGFIGVIVLIILIMYRVWIGAAMAIVGFIGIAVIGGFGQANMTLMTAPFTNVANYNITAIPMFTLMGMVIAETDIGKQLYNAMHHLIGHARGGLASATVVASGFMGAITGSENVSTVIMSKIALPEMRKLDYDDALSCASVSAGAPLAIIIPPSMPMILYGILTEESIGTLFIAGIIPGILLVMAYCITIAIYCRKNPLAGPQGPRFSIKEKLISLKGVIPVIVLFILVLGGIYGGICTTTEAGAIGAFGALIISLVSGQLTFKKFIKILKETVITVGMVLFLLAGTYVFIQFISISKVPFLLTNFITNTFSSKAIVLLMVAIMYIILGMMMPQMTMIISTIPDCNPSIRSCRFTRE